jgi:1-pyrroline-5-carboxylate dehydrogenase
MCETFSPDPFAARGEFRNEGYTDFRDPQNVQAFQAALERVRSRLGEKHPLVIAGREVWTESTFDSLNPAHPTQVAGTFSKADMPLAGQAIAAAAAAFETWKRTSADERGGLLFRAADLMRARRHEFSAWMVYEVGKSWVEADADSAEAIDFLDYYARQMVRLAREPQPYQAYGECDQLHHIPLGVGAIIPPWNFPLAIMAGMTSAAIVAGNSVVLKPASTAPQVAWEFFQVLREVGLPAGVVNYLTGPGGAIGDALVDDPRVRFVAFTGSKEVGIRIHERTARVQPGQRWLKRAILEMGGKGAVVVDETADLDATAQAIVVSAFGFGGQKCSAGSRAIVADAVYDEVLRRVVDSARQVVTVGDPDDPQHFIGPVIDAAAQRKVLSYIEIGRTEGRLVLGGNALPREGYFVEPTIFADVDPCARIAQEEIFGPVLAVIRARDYRDAVRIANDTEYGLTGSFYSHDPERIAWAKAEFHVGNLYINRKSTGALVGPHPFGGFNMSGTDSKAGGPDYLLAFTQAKSIGERM